MSYNIEEWNGNAFVDIGYDETNQISRVPSILGPKETRIQDINQDGLYELILTGDIPGMCCEAVMIPWRYKTITYSWNGRIFSASYISFAPPQYRFQAVQDADREVFYDHYDLAISLYQDAIFNNQLDWWSPERKEYLVNTLNQRYNPHPTQFPAPAPDVTEYPRLAAYALFRMVALHAYLGEIDAAKTQYGELQRLYPAGNPGHPYVEMATMFWNAYQSSQNMTTACSAAIEYAAEHPEILVPLGSDYHGWQSRIYTPADVCPFR